MSRILVTGANGQLGHDVCLELERRGIDYLGTASANMDITDRDAVRETLAAYCPNAVIHCAAYTAVDQAEEEPEKVFAVNETGTRNIAESCREANAKMLYISTDYVFSGAGTAPYEMDAPTGPLNVYGRSKLAGEQAVREILSEHFIVRISWVFGTHGKNFVKTMLRLAKTQDTVRIVNDQVGSPTYTKDLAPLLCDMVESERYGTYHATNEGFCSWAEFAGEIFREAGVETEIIPVPTIEYTAAKARRPLNSRLSKQCLEDAKFPRLPPWQDALRRFLQSEIKEM